MAAMKDKPPQMVWALEKYARYVPEGDPTLLSFQENEKTGSWKYFTSQKGSLVMSIVETNHLVVSSDECILESFLLWGSQNWIKAVVKGDSLLFIYRCQQDDNRRFRVKLSPSQSGASSTDQCKELVSALTPYVTIKDMSGTSQLADSQMCYDGSQLTQDDTFTHSTTSSGDGLNDGGQQTKTTSELAKEVLCGKPLHRAYSNTHLPTQQLGQFIRLCLTDSNFPSFVEAVEKELSNITK